MSFLLEKDRLENRTVDVKESQNTGIFATPWSMSRAAKMMTSDRVSKICPLHWAAGPRLGNPGIFTAPGRKADSLDRPSSIPPALVYMMQCALAMALVDVCTPTARCST